MSRVLGIREMVAPAHRKERFNFLTLAEEEQVSLLQK